MSKRKRNRLGFTLAEVAVSAALIAVLAAVTAPSLVSYLDNQSAKTTATTLSQLATGIASFRTSVGVYPHSVSQLTNGITTAQTNSCNVVFTAAQVTSWNTNGPFATFMVPSTGLNTGIGQITDVMLRNPTGPTGTLNGTLAIRFAAIDSADAAELDLVVDGATTATPTTGVVQYTITNHLADLSYFVPVGNHC
jgi:prepilin-type N-terminal cleavage/methylation domain-containing protein